MNRDNMAALIKEHEGVRYAVYEDTMGHPTIGVGFNLDKKGARERIGAIGVDYELVRKGLQELTEAQVTALLAIDLEDAIVDATYQIFNFAQHPDEIQAVIVDMIFNLGAAGFSKFKNTILAFEAKDYCAAAAQMADSAWAAQVPNRARDNIKIVLGYCKE
jgi:GH24 family phage-related lysozyme (muramidase)